MPSACHALARSTSVAALLCLGACSSSPTAPTTPAVSSGTLLVTASAPVLKKGSTATVTVTTAGTPVPAVTWTSSNGNVAGVTPTGLVTARLPGRATITASTSTASGRVELRVVPDFAATWTGPLSRNQPTCAIGSSAPVCLPGTPGEVLRAPVTIVLLQDGAAVTGTLVDALEPQLLVPLQGRIDDGDLLSLEGRSALTTVAASQRRMTISTLRATLDPTLDTITGSYQMLVERAGSSGTLSADYAVPAQFRDLPRR